jgi:hypothetical protein
MGWFVSPGGSWFAEFITISPSTGTESIVAYPAAANRRQIYLGGAQNAAIYDAAGVVGTANGVTLNAVSKAVSTWAAGTGRVCLNGGAVASSNTLTAGFNDSAAWGTGFLQTGTPSESGNGYMRRFTYWSRVLTNAEMQQVTT